MLRDSPDDLIEFGAKYFECLEKVSIDGFV